MKLHWINDMMRNICLIPLPWFFMNMSITFFALILQKPRWETEPLIILILLPIKINFTGKRRNFEMSSQQIYWPKINKQKKKAWKMVIIGMERALDGCGNNEGAHVFNKLDDLLSITPPEKIWGGLQQHLKGFLRIVQLETVTGTQGLVWKGDLQAGVRAPIRDQRSEVRGQGHVTCWIFFFTSGDFGSPWKDGKCSI